MRSILSLIIVLAATSFTQAQCPGGNCGVGQRLSNFVQRPLQYREQPRLYRYRSYEPREPRVYVRVTPGRFVGGRLFWR